MKRKAATVTLLILLSVSFLFMPLSIVLGQLGVNIYLVNPEEEGVVGQTVNLQGTIDTTNGKYQIWFDKELVANHTSEGYYVNANFTIPQLSGGDYTITLRDASKNVNATYAFSITMAYYIEALMPASPKQLQEGSDVVLNVKLTGLQSGTSYYANVMVELPAPLSNTSYSRLVELTISSQEAVATAQVTYPSAAFQPEGSLTNYTGSYRVYFNETQLLAEDQFFVGFTDSSEYHRGQSVAIRAIGHQPDENATISVKYAETSAIVHSETVTASSEGIINSSWTVPSDALIGDYNITITPENTAKLISDSQLFTVLGYTVKIRTLNLAGELVPQIGVEALDQATNTIYNGTSTSDGIASLNLEKGNHTISAFWNYVKVGEMNVSITEESTFDLTCELTNLKITVQNKDGNLIPFVNLDITYQYVTTKEGLSKTGHSSGQTDLSGTFILKSILPGISYTINASLYGIVFNSGNNTVTGLPVQPVSEVTILCPSRTLTLKIIDYNLAAIPNARIELFEVTSGLFHGATTDTAGTVTVEVTFGKYRLRVYKDDILLNEIVIEVFSDTQREICCSLYNIQVSVKVVDYFNQPIPNMNVVLNRPGIGTQLATTQANGTTTFGNVIGGNMQIITYPEGLENSYEAVSRHIEEPTEIRIRLAKYILIGPFLIESSALATFIVILLAIILFVSIEVYRRKRVKPASES
ncbi:carboxypeptidase regulatory-like domain-containing protein [Candidatus Bathyarchaeota archaeon]|nr:carboxypeptidase regulatory-like domain-containing protein [Candidatus Bathyarchaeota archaeon]